MGKRFSTGQSLPKGCFREVDFYHLLREFLSKMHSCKTPLELYTLLRLPFSRELNNTFPWQQWVRCEIPV